MNKNYIHFPIPNGGKYRCLEEVIKAVKKEKWNWLSTYICDIVEYNVRYRDCLRDNGIDGLIEQLYDEAPSFRDETESVRELRKWYSGMDELACYDIQCYGIRDSFEVLGKTFRGLRELRRRVEMYASENYGELHLSPVKRPAASPDGLHVGMMYRDYPKFDIYDECDDRTYDNYIIRREKISGDDMEKLYEVPNHISSLRVHERIPEELLPILYHGGYEGYLLLATRKE